MKIFCCYTPAHEILFSAHFSPSVPPGFEVQSHALSIAGAGDFLSREFLKCIREKVRLIRRSVLENEGELIIWSDVDIVFLRDAVSELERIGGGGGDLWFQRESLRLPDVNTGFMMIRCCRATEEFFSRVETRLWNSPDLNEQAIINSLLLEGDPIAWGYLPETFYARTHGWPPPRDAVLYHANYTKGEDGVGQKIAQFKELSSLQRWGLPALAWSCLRRVPSAIRGRLGIKKDGFLA